MGTPVVLVLKIIKHIAFIEYKDLKEPHIQNKATFFTTMPHKALRREGGGEATVQSQLLNSTNAKIYCFETFI